MERYISRPSKRLWHFIFSSMHISLLGCGLIMLRKSRGWSTKGSIIRRPHSVCMLICVTCKMGKGRTSLYFGLWGSSKNVRFHYGLSRTPSGSAAGKWVNKTTRKKTKSILACKIEKEHKNSTNLTPSTTNLLFLLLDSICYFTFWYTTCQS